MAARTGWRPSGLREAIQKEGEVMVMTTGPGEAKVGATATNMLGAATAGGMGTPRGEAVW